MIERPHLAAVVLRLLDLAADADALAHEIANPIAPRLELGDLLRRELNLDVSGFVAQLRLDALVEEIARVVLADYVDAAVTLADELHDVVGGSADEIDDDELEPPLCLDCGIDVIEAGECYMVRDDVWSQAAEPDAGLLCIGCLEERLGRRLEPRDFIDAPINRLPFSSPRLRSRILDVDETRLADRACVALDAPSTKGGER